LPKGEETENTVDIEILSFHHLRGKTTPLPFAVGRKVKRIGGHRATEKRLAIYGLPCSLPRGPQFPAEGRGERVKSPPGDVGGGVSIFSSNSF